MSSITLLRAKKTKKQWVVIHPIALASIKKGKGLHNKALQQTWHACKSALAVSGKKLAAENVPRAGMQARHAAELWR